MLALFLAGLVAVMAPTALANGSNVSLDAAIVNAPDKGWYGSGEIVSVVGTIINDGEATAVTVDPSCNEVLRIWKGDSLIVDGLQSCLGQTRGMDIAANSNTLLNQLNWDLKDANGKYVSSGDYIVEYIVPGEDLSSEIQVHVQTPISIPDGLELITLATSRDGVHAEGSPSLISVRLKNNLPQAVSIDFGNCALTVNDVLYGACGPEFLSGNEIVTVAQIPFSLQSGENVFDISIGDGSLSDRVIINASDDNDAGINSGNLELVALEMMVEGDTTFDELETFDSQIRITNNGDDDVLLDFTSSCLGEIWVVDSEGVVVMDTRSIKECTDLEVEYQIEKNGDRVFAQPEWAFFDLQGCHVSPGDFTVVMEIPEHDIYDTDSITITRENENFCVDESMNIDATLNGEDSLIVEPDILASGETDLTWFASCGLVTSLYNNGEVVETALSYCENDNRITVQVTHLNLESVTFDMEGLEDGLYTLQFETLTAPKIKSTVSFNWPLYVEEDTNDEIEVDETQKISRVITGTWSSTSNEIGTCWLLNTPDEGILTLSGAPGLISWLPQTGANGEYLVYDHDSSPECADFAAQAIIVEEVYSQSFSEETEEQQSEVIPATPAKAEEKEEISPVVVTVGVAVASTGILSLLFAAIATNESWRIPATSAGLWLLGLVGRTSETSDGRYQRGRLMGYLTANPGCHFRALMAALEMSNGQITHHLKILQDEGRIWRRPDGRLVRFYPFTSNLHPGILDDDLPMPPLSPDPNSLQGKILRLLDDDGQMHQFPTQAELAHRLDRSQQLVSHHLRTLQKYGLVQKQKSGVKNRYCLTKEAIFLLETTEL